MNSQKGILQGVAAGRTTLAQFLEAILTAELLDNDARPEEFNREAGIKLIYKNARPIPSSWVGRAIS